MYDGRVNEKEKEERKWKEVRSEGKTEKKRSGRWKEEREESVKTNIKKRN